MPARFRTLLALAIALVAALPARAEYLWVEGERPERATVTRHPSWYDQVKRAELSGGDFITNWGETPGVMAYRVSITSAGEREFWVRANPTAARLSYRLNGGDWESIDLEKGLQENLNVAADGKVDLRFLAWVNVGRVGLKQGANLIEFRMDSANHNHGALDCFVLSEEPFTPRGAAKPGEVSSRTRKAEAENPGWFVFDPPTDPFASTAGFDLRALNESIAGDGGFIRANGDDFIHSKTGVPVRFWAVNGPASRQLRRPASRGPQARQARRESRARPPRLLRRQDRRTEIRGDRPRPGHRRGHEAGGHLHAFLHLLSPLVEPRSRQPGPPGLHRPEASVRRTLLRRRLPGPVPRMVEGAPHHPERKDRQAADRRAGGLRGGDPQ